MKYILWFLLFCLPMSLGFSQTSTTGEAVTVALVACVLMALGALPFPDAMIGAVGGLVGVLVGAVAVLVAGNFLVILVGAVQLIGSAGAFVLARTRTPNALF